MQHQFQSQSNYNFLASITSTSLTAPQLARRVSVALEPIPNNVTFFFTEAGLANGFIYLKTKHDQELLVQRLPREVQITPSTKQSSRVKPRRPQVEASAPLSSNSSHRGANTSRSGQDSETKKRRHSSPDAASAEEPYTRDTALSIHRRGSDLQKRFKVEHVDATDSSSSGSCMDNSTSSVNSWQDRHHRATKSAATREEGLPLTQNYTSFEKQVTLTAEELDRVERLSQPLLDSLEQFRDTREKIDSVTGRLRSKLENIFQLITADLVELDTLRNTICKAPSEPVSSSTSHSGIRPAPSEPARSVDKLTSHKSIDIFNKDPASIYIVLTDLRKRLQNAINGHNQLVGHHSHSRKEYEQSLNRHFAAESVAREVTLCLNTLRERVNLLES